MKWLLLALLLAGTALVLWGPLPGIQPARRDWHAGGTTPVLQMSFAHSDHPGIQCATCHHNFAERGKMGGQACVNCHLTDATVAPLFEEQFHTLCRSCHIKEHAAGNKSGPTRRCIACHVADHKF